MVHRHHHHHNDSPSPPPQQQQNQQSIPSSSSLQNNYNNNTPPLLLPQPPKNGLSSSSSTTNATPPHNLTLTSSPSTSDYVILLLNQTHRQNPQITSIIDHLRNDFGVTCLFMRNSSSAEQAPFTATQEGSSPLINTQEEEDPTTNSSSREVDDQLCLLASEIHPLTSDEELSDPQSVDVGGDPPTSTQSVDVGGDDVELPPTPTPLIVKKRKRKRKRKKKRRRRSLVPREVFCCDDDDGIKPATPTPVFEGEDVEGGEEEERFCDDGEKESDPYLFDEEEGEEEVVVVVPAVVGKSSSSKVQRKHKRRCDDEETVDRPSAAGALLTHQPSVVIALPLPIQHPHKVWMLEEKSNVPSFSRSKVSTAALSTVCQSAAPPLAVEEEPATPPSKTPPPSQRTPQQTLKPPRKRRTNELTQLLSWAIVEKTNNNNRDRYFKVTSDVTKDVKPPSKSQEGEEEESLSSSEGLDTATTAAVLNLKSPKDPPPPPVAVDVPDAILDTAEDPAADDAIVEEPPPIKSTVFEEPPQTLPPRKNGGRRKKKKKTRKLLAATAESAIIILQEEEDVQISKEEEACVSDVVCFTPTTTEAPTTTVELDTTPTPLLPLPPPSPHQKPPPPSKMHLRKSKTNPANLFYSSIASNVRNNLEHFLDGKPTPSSQLLRKSWLGREPPTTDPTKKRKQKNTTSTKNGYLLHHGDNFPQDPEAPYRLHLATQILLKLNKRGFKYKVQGEKSRSLLSYLRLVPRKRTPRGSLLKNEDSIPIAKKEEQEVTVFSGEWVKERNYICNVCGAVEGSFWDMVHHKGEVHPGVVCTHVEVASLLVKGNDDVFVRGRVGLEEEGDSGDQGGTCAKCGGVFETTPLLHTHIFACAGNQQWLEPKPVDANATPSPRKRKRRRVTNFCNKRPRGSPQKKQSETLAESIKYKCLLCPREFKTEGWLRNHFVGHEMIVKVPLGVLKRGRGEESGEGVGDSSGRIRKKRRSVESGESTTVSFKRRRRKVVL